MCKINGFDPSRSSRTATSASGSASEVQSWGISALRAGSGALASVDPMLGWESWLAWESHDFLEEHYVYIFISYLSI
jgi:hypothetical protein